MIDYPYSAELSVDGYLAGVRIDPFLVRQFRNYTPYRMQRLVRAGAVQVNENTAEVAQRVYPGDTVRVTLIEPPDRVLPPEPLPLAAIYEDPWIIVVDKPPGQITHPAGELQRGTLCNALQHHFDCQTALPGLLKPGIVHRLDRMTSGIIVVTKEHLAHRHLSLQFQQERVSKTYLAIVEGAIGGDRGLIDAPIGNLPDAGTVLMTCQPGARDPKPAATEFVVLERLAGRTLVRAHPHTGRNHQIRLHFAHIGHPVLGDEFYGPHGAIKLSRAEYNALREAALEDAGEAATFGSRHALHAHRIEFRHPIFGGRVAFESPLPGDLRRLLNP